MPFALVLHISIAPALHALTYRTFQPFTAALGHCSCAALMAFADSSGLQSALPLAVSTRQSLTSALSCCDFIWLSLPRAQALHVAVAPALYALDYALRSALPLVATSRRSLPSLLSCCDFTRLSLPLALAIHFAIAPMLRALNYRTSWPLTAALGRCSPTTLTELRHPPGLIVALPLAASSQRSLSSSWLLCCDFTRLSVPFALVLHIAIAPALQALTYRTFQPFTAAFGHDSYDAPVACIDSSGLQSALPLAVSSRR